MQTCFTKEAHKYKDWAHFLCPLQRSPPPVWLESSSGMESVQVGITALRPLQIVFVSQRAVLILDRGTLTASPGVNVREVLADCEGSG